MQTAIRTKASAHLVSALMGALVCLAVQRQFAAAGTAAATASSGAKRYALMPAC